VNDKSIEFRDSLIALMKRYDVTILQYNEYGATIFYAATPAPGSNIYLPLDEVVKEVEKRRKQ
jgi:hypothetical protein